MGERKTMDNKTFQTEVLDKTQELLNNLPKERLKEVVGRRFGFINGKQETLETIGKNYGITRERVRQIESDALKILSQPDNLFILKPIFDYLDAVFKEHNHLLGEERLLNLTAGTSGPHPARSAVIMILTLGNSYEKIAEDNRFHSHWVTQKQAREYAEKVVDYLVNHFNQHKKVFSAADVLNIISSAHKDASSKFIESVLDISKEINQNIFGEMGLTHWSEISPKGTRDKAYLVLKKKNEPRHFVEITDLINQANFSSREAFPQTVHNELIKDDRFVLVGRGTYALKEWGYSPGIVKEVIADILSKAKKPLTKDEIISAVLETRRVKPNTVVINLQNSQDFEKLNNGTYRLA